MTRGQIVITMRERFSKVRARKQRRESKSAVANRAGEPREVTTVDLEGTKASEAR